MNDDVAKSEGLDNPVAFPGQDPVCGGYNSGMTLRDWFAGQVIAEMVISFERAGASYGPEDCAASAYDLADAMLAARSPINPKKDVA